jgi:ATP-dependent RNA helicase DHX8/PRP22
MADADLYNLEFLSLVNKITQEINNHTGYNDKTLAEFVISLHESSKTLPDFKQKMKESGAEFPESFIENIDRLVLNMHPKHKKKLKPKKSKAKAKENDANGTVQLDELDRKKRMFPGLSKPDQEWQPSVTKDALMQEVDDMMAAFEGGAKKARARSPEGERSLKRPRKDHSMSPPRRRSPSPPRGRSYGDGRRDRYDERSRQAVDQHPVLYKIYNGRVQGLKEFGAFVQLEGIAGRVEGEYFYSSLICTGTVFPSIPDIAGIC